MTDTLKQTVRRRFEEISLDAAQLAALERMATPSRAPGRATRWAAVAAMLVLAALAGALGADLYRGYQADRLLQAIAQEVAENHFKLKPLEVESDDLGQVLGYFDELDFKLLQEPAIAGGPGERLLGGRYCSIQGVDAAQFRVRGADGEMATWYQGTLPPEKLALIPDTAAGEPPWRGEIRGLDVRIWRSQGVVFVQAR